MKWNESLFKVEWSQTITNYEEKQNVAEQLAAKVKDGDVIAFGSGSTSFLATKAIAKRVNEERLQITALPTSNEIRMTCITLGLSVATLNDVRPDWGFDGADEVDANGWLIKGRGGAMFNEKILMANSPMTYILVDRSKFVHKLCEKFPVPVECSPAAYMPVLNALHSLGASATTIRLAGASKDGPVITESGNFIIDAVFDNIEENLERKIKMITGVIESGLFINYKTQIVTC